MIPAARRVPIRPGSRRALASPAEAERRYDFANILFAGPCNRACPWCIGKELPASANVRNLDQFPLAGMDAFVAAVREHAVPEVIFTGTTTDPQLYRYQRRLIDFLREQTPPGTRLSIHTNGALTLRQLEIFNAYDKACLSFPSFDPDIYQRLMGSRGVPDLAAIVGAARIPLKVSCVVNEHNADEVPAFVDRLNTLGIRRLALRRLFGSTDERPLLTHLPIARMFRGNPVRYYGELEITDWRFEKAEMRSLNLYANGLLSDSYLLAETPEFRRV